MGEGIVDEVAEDAFKRIGVTAHGGVVVCPQCDRRVRCAPPHVFDELECDRGKVDGRSGWVCFETGEREKVVDETAESFAVTGDGRFEVVALGSLRLLA